MNPITPLPAFAPLAPPPAPRILSIYATDLSARPSRRLIANEDLPLKPSHFHPYQSSSLSPQTHTGQLPHTSQSSKSRVSHAASDRNLTPLSSLSPTPVRNMSPTSDQTSDLSKVEGPRRYPHRIISSAGTSGTSAPAPRITLLPAKKVRLERPKGAGRSNLPQLLGWDDSLHEAIKVCVFSLVNLILLIWNLGGYATIHWPTLDRFSQH
jgi:hypothetical protein